MVDGAGGFYDIYTSSTLEDVTYPDPDITECWARLIKKGKASRSLDGEQTAQFRSYDLEVRVPPDYRPKKNTLVQIINYTETDATVQGWEWDDRNKVITLTAVERL